LILSPIVLIAALIFALLAIGIYREGKNSLNNSDIAEPHIEPEGNSKG
jgi:hypothetical protein